MYLCIMHVYITHTCTCVRTHTHLRMQLGFNCGVPFSLQQRRLNKIIRFPSFVNVESFSFCSKGNGCSKVQWHQTPSSSGRCGYPVAVTEGLKAKTQEHVNYGATSWSIPYGMLPSGLPEATQKVSPWAREWWTAQVNGLLPRDPPARKNPPIAHTPPCPMWETRA